MAVTRERFESGLTYEQWLAAMTKNKERFEQNYQTATILPEDAAFFASLPEPLNVLVLAEDWCGDVIANLPVLAKLAHAANGKLLLRIFLRDQNLDIMDQYLYQGKFRSIPTFVFFDQHMNEVGRWMERPQLARQEMDDGRSRFVTQHPELPDADKPFQDMSEATRQVYAASLSQFRAENAARWAQAVVDEVRAVVTSGLRI